MLHHIAKSIFLLALMENYMRKLILLSAIVFVSVQSYSQDFGGGLKLGLEGSSVLASIGNSSDEVGALFPNFHIGGYGRIDFAEFLRFQLEVMYARRGGSFTNLSGGKVIGGNTYDLEYTDKLNYLDIPLVFMLHGGMSAFQFGVQPSFLVGQETTIEGTLLDAGGNQIELAQVFGGDIENFRAYSGNDFSFLFGYQLDVPMGLNVGFRILYSLGNIYDIDKNAVSAYTTDPETGEDNFDRFYRFDDARNVSAQLSVGYTFKR
jgi:hypothetical protein